MLYNIRENKKRARGERDYRLEGLDEAEIASLGASHPREHAYALRIIDLIPVHRFRILVLKGSSASCIVKGHHHLQYYTLSNCDCRNSHSEQRHQGCTISASAVRIFWYRPLIPHGPY